jgi:energy-coupling factor transporter ATP-binding protein EcfA2
MFRYRVFGFHINSEIPFEELGVWSSDHAFPDSKPPVRLTLGSVPEHILFNEREDGWIEATKEQCLFNIHGQGRILVSRGEEIRIDAASQVALDDLRPYMITCGFGTIAFQRGLLPLHLSAVMTPKGAWLFTGPSGAGKSTTAAALSRLTGWPLLGDDLAVFDADEKRLNFGVNKIKLWEDAAEMLGLDVRDLKRDYFRPHKYHVQIEPTDSIGLNEVIGVSELKWGESVVFVPSTQRQCFAALMNSIYPAFLAPIYVKRNEISDKISKILPIKFATIISRPQTQSTGRTSIDDIRRHIELALE